MNPTHPISKTDSPKWNEAFMNNTQRILDHMDDGYNVDVVMIGEIVEHWVGKGWDQLQSDESVFEKLFNDPKHGITAIDLGIAGDHVRNENVYVLLSKMCTLLKT